jgi:mlo protein
MGGAGGAAAAAGTRSLDQTPTWAVAAVCAVIVAASILLEGLLHHLGQVRRGFHSLISALSSQIFVHLISGSAC